MVFGAVHMNLGLFHELKCNGIGVTLIRVEAVFINDRHTGGAVTIIAYEMAVLTPGICHKALAAAITFGLNGFYAIDKGLAADKTGFFSVDVAHFN
jgi:hypothetical protein